MIRRPAVCALAVLAAMLLTDSAPAGQTTNDGPEVGLDDLVARLGAGNVPTGAGVIVAQVEAPDAQGDYGPNPAHAQNVGKTFIPHSGPTNTSGHANNVGFNFYGNTLSIAPGITEINEWNVNGWIAAGFLRSNSALEPDPATAGLKILNHSWIGAFPFASQNNDALRRADFVMNRDGTLMCVGIDNDEPGVATDDVNVALMSHVFNGLSVGVSDGSHMNDATLPDIDGPGRMIPEIVAPGSKTSWAVPVVSAGAALMVETARTTPALAGNPAAEQGIVLKAVLLAGANHRAGWTNNPVSSGPDRGVASMPLDDLFGAGLLDVNTSHMILTGSEQDGSATPPSANNVSPQAGWDLAGVGLGESRYWRLNVCQLTGEASFLATWNRDAQPPFGNADWAVADFDLILWRVDEQEQLATLVGDPGLPFFGGGNVVSAGSVDNIAHLFVLDLAAGTYVLELRRVDAGIDHPQWSAVVAWHMPPTAIAGDLDGDCTVGIVDFLAMLSAWGPCPDPCLPSCPADLDGDCMVGITDFLALLANWG